MPEVGRIASVMSFGLGITLPDGRTGYVHMSDMPDWPHDETVRRERFPIGSAVAVDVVSTEGRWPGLRLAEAGGTSTVEPERTVPLDTHSEAHPAEPPHARSPEDPPLPEGDPDPFAETPLDPGERAEMLERLAKHMRPLVAEADEETRSTLREAWNDLRRQSTVEAFHAKAERLLAALDDVNT